MEWTNEAGEARREKIVAILSRHQLSKSRAQSETTASRAWTVVEIDYYNY